MRKKNPLKEELTPFTKQFFGILSYKEMGGLSKRERICIVTQNNCITWLSSWLNFLPINVLNYDKTSFEFASLRNPFRHL